MTPTLQFKKQVLREVERQGITATFAMLLLSYEDKAKRMEAFYWDCDRFWDGKILKMMSAFGLSRHQTLSLSRIYEASKRG